MWVMWNLILVLLETVLDRYTVCAKRTLGSETALGDLMVLLGDEARVEAQFGLFIDSANLDAR
jgi:hypothetical protein